LCKASWAFIARKKGRKVLSDMRELLRNARLISLESSADFGDAKKGRSSSLEVLLSKRGITVHGEGGKSCYEKGGRGWM